MTPADSETAGLQKKLQDEENLKKNTRDIIPFNTVILTIFTNN
jgi:hypothetical protein